MTIDYDLLETMTDYVTVEPKVDQDAYTKPVYGERSEPIRCRIDGQQKLVRDTQGRTVVSTLTIIASRPVDIKVGDRVTLGDGTQPPVLAIDQMPDERGAYYTVIYT